MRCVQNWVRCVQIHFGGEVCSILGEVCSILGEVCSKLGEVWFRGVLKSLVGVVTVRCGLEVFCILNNMQFDQVWPSLGKSHLDHTWVSASPNSGSCHTIWECNSTRGSDNTPL